MLTKVFSAQQDLAAMQERALGSGLRLPYRVMFADKADSYDARMKARYFSFWEQMPLKPAEVVEVLCEGLSGGPDDLVIRDIYLDPIIENDTPRGLRVETKFVPRRELGDYSGYYYLNNDREYDFTTGTCTKGDIRTDGLIQKGIGRVAVRNALQLVYSLGCPKIEISATRVGCLLWLQNGAYDITTINPKYLNNIRARWDTIEKHCPEAVDRQSVRAAIDAGDLRKIAASEADIGSALAHTPGGRHIHHELSLKNGAIPLNRFLLFDAMIDCWQGQADMDNMAQRSKLGNLLGGWTSKQLAPKASILESSFNYLEPSSL